jgi:ABC-type lipoprotein export system ATPase subunit
MNNSPILEAKSLSKKFSLGGKVLEVIRDVSFSIHPATSLSIRGESGCGKTTLLNLLARIEQADKGELLWGDQWMRCDRPATRTEVSNRASFLGVVYQAYYLVPELDVLENVILSARISGNLNDAVTERAHLLLQQMGVAEKARQIPGKLSGGERQRVAIARALINQPKVLLADEPTGNLDERTGEEVMNLLLRTCSEEGASLVLVTHNPSFARSTDRQLFLFEGRMNEV